MARLSHLASERELQKYMLAVVGLLILAVLVVGGLAIVEAAAAGSTEEGGRVPYVPLRAALGVLMTLASLRLAVLVARHRDGIRTVFGLKRQYVTACVVTAVFGMLLIFFWWTAVPASVVGLACLVRVVSIRTVPAAEMTAQIDYHAAEAWDDLPGSLQQRRPWVTFLLVCLLGFLLGAVLIVVVFLLAG